MQMKKHSKKSHTASIKAGRHRPILIKSKSGWKRPKRSRCFKKPVFLKGKHRKKSTVSFKATQKKAGKSLMKHRKRSLAHRGQIVVFAGKKHHRKHGRRHYLRGGGLMQNIGGNAINVIAGIAGATIGSFAGNMIPANSKIKALIPILLGVVLSSSTKIPAVRYAGLGIAVMGGLSLINQVMPKGLPLIAGESVYVPLLPDMSSVMGDQVRIAGAAGPARSGMQWQTAANAA